jgi:hypothetical protein
MAGSPRVVAGIGLSRRSCAKADDPGLGTESIRKFRLAGVAAAYWMPAAQNRHFYVRTKYFAEYFSTRFLSRIKANGPARRFEIADQASRIASTV